MMSCILTVIILLHLHNICSASTHHYAESAHHHNKEYPAHQHPAAYNNNRVQQPYICYDRDLDCTFSTTCRWRNGTNDIEDDFDWLLADKVVVDNWHSIPRGRNGQGDIFAYTRGAFGSTKHKDSTALLISDPIYCQTGEGTLTFWYWKTAIYPTLLVCIRRPIESQVGDNVNCISTIKGFHGQEWIGETLKIPASTEPFQIVFEGRFLHTHDTIGLDDISYKANVCQCYSPTSSTKRPIYDGVNYRCTATDCDFDSGNICTYDSQDNGAVAGLQPGSVVRKWVPSTKGQIGNSLTGIPRDSTGKNFGFLYAGDTLKKQDTFVLKSRRFKIDSAEAKLTYFLYQAGVEGRFRLCLNDLHNCVVEILGKDIKRDARQWRQMSVVLSPGTYQLIFVADDLDKNYVVGLDDIRLVGNSAYSRVPCEIIADP